MTYEWKRISDGIIRLYRTGHVEEGVTPDPPSETEFEVRHEHAGTFDIYRAGHFQSHWPRLSWAKDEAERLQAEQDEIGGPINSANQK